ncbi:hypothetical protein HYQ44_004348 [Verticillium longisporum]|nr:hypothetical protein HYQ44_004348 [Verticillium longisporum]
MADFGGASRKQNLLDLRRYGDFSPSNPDSPLVVSKATGAPRLPRPSASSVIKISAFGSLSTSPTTSPLPPLRTPKQKLEFFLFDVLFQQTPPVDSTPDQLPHRTHSEPLPLVEGESRRTRQIAEGSACYRFRPP